MLDKRDNIILADLQPGRPDELVKSSPLSFFVKTNTYVTFTVEKVAQNLMYFCYFQKMLIVNNWSPSLVAQSGHLVSNQFCVVKRGFERPSKIVLMK
jgi:hypothetical protein